MFFYFFSTACNDDEFNTFIGVTQILLSILTYGEKRFGRANNYVCTSQSMAIGVVVIGI